MLVVQDLNEKSLPAMEILEKAVKRGNIGSLLMDPTFFVTKNGGKMYPIYTLQKIFDKWNWNAYQFYNLDEYSLL